MYTLHRSNIATPAELLDQSDSLKYHIETPPMNSISLRINRSDSSLSFLSHQFDQMKQNSDVKIVLFTFRQL